MHKQQLNNKKNQVFLDKLLLIINILHFCTLISIPTLNNNNNNRATNNNYSYKNDNNCGLPAGYLRAAGRTLTKPRKDWKQTPAGSPTNQHNTTRITNTTESPLQTLRQKVLQSHSRLLKAGPDRRSSAGPEQTAFPPLPQFFPPSFLPHPSPPLPPRLPPPSPAWLGVCLHE